MFGPAFFSISGRWAVEQGEGFGCECEVCHRKVSAPHRFQGATIWCLYCGLERGLVPGIELQGGLEFDFGITREECAMVEKNMHRLDDWVLERSRALGHVWFEIG